MTSNYQRREGVPRIKIRPYQRKNSDERPESRAQEAESGLDISYDDLMIAAANDEPISEAG